MTVTNTNLHFIFFDGKIVSLKRLDGVRFPEFGKTVSIEIQVLNNKQEFVCHTTEDGFLEAPAHKGLPFKKFRF